MWIGAGDHFSFMNQPEAASANFGMLVDALRPLLDTRGQAAADEVVEANGAAAQDAFDVMLARKLGFDTGVGPAGHRDTGAGAVAGEGDGEEEGPADTGRAAAWARQLWGTLEPLMEHAGVDWTIFWRQLAAVAGAALGTGTGTGTDFDGSLHMGLLAPALYQPLAEAAAGAWARWVEGWLGLLSEEGTPGDVVAARMKAASPKYIPREWMLRAAYTAADAHDYSIVATLAKLFEAPYDEHPGHEAEYYTRAPDGAAYQGGLGFMS